MVKEIVNDQEQEVKQLFTQGRFRKSDYNTIKVPPKRQTGYGENGEKLPMHDKAGKLTPNSIQIDLLDVCV